MTVDADVLFKPQDLVNPLIKHKIVSVEEKIEEMCLLLEEQDEASLFFLLKDSESRSELVARFMGILELIKIHRITITTVNVVEDVIEYGENGLVLYASKAFSCKAIYRIADEENIDEKMEEILAGSLSGDQPWSAGDL